MGKVGSTLFGKPATSTSSSSSGNVNNDMLTGALGGTLGGAGTATNLMTSLLNGSSTDGINAYANSGGMDFLMQQGQKAITSSKAASGLLNSGSYGTALSKFGTGLASTYLDQYMNHLNQLGQLGLGAGGILADSGKVSESESEDKGAKKGIAGSLIKGASLIPGVSDRRLKTNIEKVGEYADGLGRYRWSFVEGMGLPEGRHEGVMADEVKELRPQAYLENFWNGYDGVDYGRL